MNHPPDGCSYRIYYPAGRQTRTATFADEFAFGRWFREQERAGHLDRTDRGLSVHCVTEDGDVPIDIMHPRLVRGRLEAPPDA
jgi:hypothetical protein